MIAAPTMSDFDNNPFADPDLNNPFKDPSVTQVTRNVLPGLDEYNPFSDSRIPLSGNVKIPNVPSTQTAIMKPAEEPPAYAQIAKEHALAQAELLKRQEELERKAAELDRREREMQGLNQQRGRKNNWPPLPENFPVGPCFYQDFSVDIPVEFQKTVKIMYYLWMFHTVTLFLNIFGCLAWFYIDATRGVDFGLSILWFLLFTPCSFVCWYRPLYGAFRSDSSFRFFVFFFVYICQFAVHVLQAAGFQRWGNCGWISSLTGLNKSIPVGIMMIIIAALFTASAVISLVMFKKVHGLYRTTGASFEKAQQEFATGMMSNKTVQTAAANAASTAATNAAQSAFKGNQM
nr:secretory carrier-associated membrane protein 1-like isoform X1 [Anas platyrhynchos]